MTWSTRYLDIPEAECHCWELARRIYRGELGIVLPAYEGALASSEERAEVAALVDGEMGRARWQAVDSDDIRPFDVLVFRRGRLRSHIGIAIDRRHMIHMLGRSHVERFVSPYWCPRLTGVYRHVKPPVEATAGEAA